MKRRRNSGYTLLEFLVAMVIMGIITPGVTLALRAATVAMDRSEARAARMQQVRAAFDVLSRDISFAVLPSASQGSSTSDSTTISEPTSWFVGSDDSSGNIDTDSLEIITASGRVGYAEMLADNTPDAAEEPPSYLVQVAYSLEPSESGEGFDLIRRHRSPPSPDGDRSDLLVEEVVVKGISGLDFSYFDGTDWLDSWDTTLDTELGLPVAVRITLTIREGNTEEVYITTVPVYSASSSSTSSSGTSSSAGQAPSG